MGRMDQERYDEAEHYILEALQGYRMWYGPDHYKTADVLHEYAVLLSMDTPERL